MDELAATGGIFGVFIIITAIVAFLMPFFVLRIRNESIKTNKKLDEIAGLIRDQYNVLYDQNTHLESANKEKGTKATRALLTKSKNICRVCDTENKPGAEKCRGCGDETL